jgi:hypothetical protein
VDRTNALALFPKVANAPVLPHWTPGCSFDEVASITSPNDALRQGE